MNKNVIEICPANQVFAGLFLFCGAEKTFFLHDCVGTVRKRQKSTHYVI